MEGSIITDCLKSPSRTRVILESCSLLYIGWFRYISWQLGIYPQVFGKVKRPNSCQLVSCQILYKIKCVLFTSSLDQAKRPTWFVWSLNFIQHWHGLMGPWSCKFSMGCLCIKSTKPSRGPLASNHVSTQFDFFILFYPIPKYHLVSNGKNSF